MTKQCSSCGGFCDNVYQRENVAQIKEREPVAFICEFYADEGYPFVSFEPVRHGTNTPLYTTPPQRKPLTRGQIREIEVDVSLNPSFDYITPAEQLCRAIEAAHGIKGD